MSGKGEKSTELEALSTSADGGEGGETRAERAARAKRRMAPGLDLSGLDLWSVGGCEHAEPLVIVHYARYPTISQEWPKRLLELLRDRAAVLRERERQATGVPPAPGAGCLASPAE